MDLDDLSVLQEVIDAGGFSKAAKRLHLTQSAVSQTIRRLEDRFGTKLVERGTPPTATPAGRRVLAYTRDALEGASALQRDLADLSRPALSRVSLGASRVITEFFLPDVLVALRQRTPHHVVDVRTLPSRELVTKVRRGELALGFGPFQSQMEGLSRRPYFQQAFHLYAADRHPLLAALKRGDDDALKQCVLLTSHLDPLEHRPARQRLRYRFAGVWEVTSLVLRLDLIAAGTAIGYLPEIYVRRRGRGKGLRQLNAFDFGAVERTFGLYFQKRAELSPAATSLVTELDHRFG